MYNGTCHYIFDIYNENPSVKDSERLWRSSVTPVILSTIKQTTPLPKAMSTFWSSSENKLLLEKLIYKKHGNAMIPGFHAMIALSYLLKLLVLGSWCDECIMIYFKTLKLLVLASWQGFYTPTDPKINPQLCLDMTYPPVKFHVD